jgi:hypothetical protein
MPLGSRHDDAGVLLREHGQLILQRDDGGRWRLNADAAADAMLGGRVRVEGIRSGFDVLDVAHIARC